jgi:peptidoglycan/xylan/chitin deacetylase (PgdA/CDA1 family)
MAAHHAILAKAYQPIRAAKVVAERLGISRADRLRTLLYHDVPASDEARFESQLRWLARRWQFATPERAEAMLAGDESIRGRHLLLTFDDGFLSNRAAAERVLRPKGIRALFFAVSDFVGLRDRSAVRQFIAARILSSTDAAALPAAWANMAWSDLQALL